MSYRLSSKVFISSAMLLSSGLFAQDPASNAAPTQGSTPLYAMGLASARPEVKHGANLFVTGDLLIWQTRAQGLAYAVLDKEPNLPITEDETNITNFNKAHVKNPDFSYQYGFQVGLGYNLSHDGWDTLVNWTWFRDHARSSVYAEDPYSATIYPTMMSSFIARLGANSLTSLSAQSHYKLHLNLLDWEMGREFFAGKSLTLRPFFGVRSAWIKQKYEVDYNNVYLRLPVCSKFTTNITNNFWGLGPRVGLNGEWQLGSGLSLYGNAALSALYGFFHLYQSEHVDNPIDDPDQGSLFPTADAAGQVTGINNSFHAVKVATDLQIGLRWDYMFCHDACHIGLHAGWQQELFFSQNQIMNFPNFYENGQFYQNQGDLGFQGWTVGARFDF